jgi:hypothetical protein
MNYGIADSARKGYDAFNDAPSPHAVRLYVRRINSAALALRSFPNNAFGARPHWPRLL